MMAQRRTPEQWLEQAQAEEDASKRPGKLKVFLGYASGVGKSFRMVDEGRRRKERGEDVIVGAIQAVTSPEVQEVLKKLEIAPIQVIQGIPVINIPAMVRRRPGVCLVDGLAYENPPGSRNPHRWNDVEELLDAGIDVITSLNIQYIAELRDRVEALTGKHVTSTVPQSFLYAADEIVVVDIPPELCLTRSPAGESREEAGGAARELSELREIALLFAADVVDHQLEGYLERHGLTSSFGTQERIVVCITPRANAKTMIESGRRNASRFHGELIVVYVKQGDLSAKHEASLATNLSIARENRAEIQILEGDDPVNTILAFARARGVTQVFLGHTLRDSRWWRHSGNQLDRLIERAHGIDVRIFPH